MNVASIKAAVRERDGYKCTECGMSHVEHVTLYGRALEVHRLAPGSPYTVEGSVTLCKTCHGPKPKRKSDELDRGRPGLQQPLMAWIDPDLYGALQAYLASQRPKPTTTSVLEVALEDFLRGKGFWPPAEEGEE